MRTGRFARFAKLPRIIRYARSLRPLLRFARALGLMARGIDRVVRQYSHVINCNVILHPTQGEHARYAQEKRDDDDLDWSKKLRDCGPIGKYPCVNPDEFKRWAGNRRPKGWSVAVRRASRIHVNHIRFLLEMH